MKKDKKVLTIGELSKMTGAGVKSLRYYEQIGVLIPAYTDPETKYRYYTLWQILLVFLIQDCIRLGIPLKDISQFMDENQRIDYESLLDHGESILEIEIKKLQKNLNIIKLAQKDVQRIKKNRKNSKVYQRHQDETFLYVRPYNPYKGTRAIYEQLALLFQTAIEEEIDYLYEWGFLHEYSMGEIKSYVFLETTELNKNNECVKVLPEGDYLCLLNEGSQIKDTPLLFPQQFQEKDYILAIETIFFRGSNEENKTLNELRILI